MRALHRLVPGPGERLLPAVSAVLLALSFPPLHLLVPPFVALVPFAVWMAGLPKGREGATAALRGGGLLGALYYGVLLYWILVALVWYSKLAALAYLGTVVGLTLFGGLIGWTTHRLLNGARVPLWVALPVAWTGVEWTRANLPGELAFPWLGLGTSLTGYPELVGVAELVGARGVTLWLVVVNALLAVIVMAIRDGRPLGERLRLTGAVVVVVGLPMVWGIWRADTLPMRPAATVAVVQPNIPEEIKLGPDRGIDSTRTSLAALLPSIPREGVDLVAMPEITYGAWIELDVQIRREVASLAGQVGAPILLGSIGHQRAEDQSLIPFNSAFLVDPASGLTDYRYDKHRLVPIVERTPLPFLLERLDFFGAYGRGTDWPLGKTANGATFGTLICYESSYPDVARSFRRAGADLLVNLTNDAWYGRERWYAKTTALWQHPAHLVMRAIETRVGIARSANTGISLFVDPVGHVSEETRLFTPDLRIAQVLTTDVVTLYTRWGDLAGTGAALAVLLLWGIAWRRGYEEPDEPQAAS